MKGRPFPQIGALVSMLALVAVSLDTCAPMSVHPVSQASTVIDVDWEQIIGPGPSHYGVEYGWIDEDSELFLQRYRLLHPNTLRVQVTQEYFEPVNDNDDPNDSEIDFDVTITFDAAEGKHLSFRRMFTTLAATFPEMEFHINLWQAARWNAANPQGYLVMGGAFPPKDYAEHQEFVRELARWLVDTCKIAPTRLSFSFVNEPNLTPFFVGTQADLLRMASVTRAALDEIAQEIQLMGLDEVHGTDWSDTFSQQKPEGCCSAWTLHAYQKGTDALWKALASQVESLSRYGPVWVTEFADTANGSPDAQMDFSSREAALGFAEVAGQLWASGADGIIHFRLADSYVDQLGGWAGHGLFADWRGTKSGGEPYAIYPSFWVFANLFGQLGDGELISTSTNSDLVIVGVRRDDLNPPRLALWLTNPAKMEYSTTVRVASFPVMSAQVNVVNNLSGDTVVTGAARGEPLEFSVVIPERSSCTIIIEQATPVAVYLPSVQGAVR